MRHVILLKSWADLSINDAMTMKNGFSYGLYKIYELRWIVFKKVAIPIPGLKLTGIYANGDTPSAPQQTLEDRMIAIFMV